MYESQNTISNQILVFTLDKLAYALPLTTVVRVIHSIEIRLLPKAPEIISGIINVQGLIITVADIRKRFGLAARETDPDDRLIIAETENRKIAILVDTVIGVRDLPTGQQNQAIESFPFAEYLKGVTKIDHELILIYDLEQFLSIEEERLLVQALKAKIE